MADKIGRDAFLYLEPKLASGMADFAQCGACRLFVPGTGKGDGRCVIHGSNVSIGADDSCGFFVAWPTPDGKPKAKELAKGIPGSVTPKDSGLVDRLVQCHRCRFAADVAVTKCQLFDDLNTKFPEIFGLDTKIQKHACCNAQVPY